MADLDRLKREIAEIAERPNAVTFDEITRLADQLELNGYSVEYTKRTHGWLFVINEEIFGVSDHNHGRAQIKPKYVRNFLNAMINLGLYGG
jgi:hypothetical protein